MKVNTIYEDEKKPYWHPFPDEMPEENRLLYVIDAKGNRQGHLGTKIVWDGKCFRTDLAHVLLVDPDNIVGWRYLNEDRESLKENGPVMGFRPYEWHKFPQEKPEADRPLYVIDNTGRRQGLQQVKVIWDGYRFRALQRCRLMVDADNIVGWRYLETPGNRDVIEEN